MTPKHLVAAVKILSSSRLDQIVTPPTLREKYWVARMTFGEEILIEEVQKLIAYLNAQAFWPRFWDKSEGKEGINRSGIPWQLAVVASLTRNGCTLEEAWTMPEAEAIWMHVAHSTSQGADVSVMTDEEWEAIQKYKTEQEAGKRQN